MIQAALENGQPTVLAAVRQLGIAEEHIPEVEKAIVSILGRIPLALAAIDDISEIAEGLSHGSVDLDELFVLAKKILTPPVCVQLFKPYAEMLLRGVSDLVQETGDWDESTLAVIRGLGEGVAQYLVGNGLRPFMTQWIKLMESMPSLTAQEAVGQLQSLLGTSSTSG